ncbi:MAG: ubiquinone/menaquinone biosynthesis methyltransferase [marine bacterium B5-7]|nr:MAG: ubiquinone/menaquinone biosynthesis methyltransferase [marine bacterium B5-7]
MSDDTIGWVDAVTDVVADAIDCRLMRIVDVGCGTGALVRWLAAHGARVTGIETQNNLVERAREMTPVADEDYVHGRGEALPLESNSVDIVVYSYSLHHVPVAVMGDALREAHRVLKPQGMLLVVEPVADGDYFEVMRLIDDETEVRRQAFKALQDEESHSLNLGEERFYRIANIYRDVEVMMQRLVQVDPARAMKIEENKEELRSRFESHGKAVAGGYRFEMKIRSNLLHKPISI